MSLLKIILRDCNEAETVNTKNAQHKPRYERPIRKPSRIFSHPLVTAQNIEGNTIEFIPDSVDEALPDENTYEWLGALKDKMLYVTEIKTYSVVNRTDETKGTRIK